MNEPEDRVLEHALREVLYEETTDLPERVLRAWREAEDAANARKTPYLWLVAAAAGLIALLLLRQSEPATSAVVATSVEALGVLSEGNPQTQLRSSFHVGETLVNGPREERHVDLAGGGSLTLGRCSMLTLERDEAGLLLTPLLGEVTLQTVARSGVRVRTSLGTVDVTTPASLEIELLAEGYTLEHPERFQQLAKEIHMKSAIPLILTMVTVVEGAALLETETSTRELVTGETVQDREGELSAKEIKARLLEAVGTWDLTVTELDPGGEPRGTLTGEEICLAGPGDEWLITDMTLKAGLRTVSTHTVIGYNARKRSYTGTLVDSFGGEMGLIRGTVGEDLESRTLSMFSAESTPGFDVKWHMSWRSADERVTRMEALQGDEWIVLREIVHRRRK